MGFYYEANAVALDNVLAGKENTIMPWTETVRLVEIVDEVQGQAGVKSPQDEF